MPGAAVVRQLWHPRRRACPQTPGRGSPRGGSGWPNMQTPGLRGSQLRLPGDSHRPRVAPPVSRGSRRPSRETAPHLGGGIFDLRVAPLDCRVGPPVRQGEPPCAPGGPASLPGGRPRIAGGQFRPRGAPPFHRVGPPQRRTSPPGDRVFPFPRREPPIPPRKTCPEAPVFPPALRRNTPRRVRQTDRIPAGKLDGRRGKHSG